MSPSPSKAFDRVRNWQESSQTLVKGGSPTVWVDHHAPDAWSHASLNP